MKSLKNDFTVKLHALSHQIALQRDSCDKPVGHAKVTTSFPTGEKTQTLEHNWQKKLLIKTPEVFTYYQQ